MSPTPLRIAITALMLLALAACSSIVPPNFRRPENPTGTIDLARKQLQGAAPCCGSFADLSYQDMLPWQPKRFELGANSPVANLNGDRSYFLAFRLPGAAKLPYTISMKSELNGRWLSSSYLFAPTAVLLDDAFQPIHSEDVQLCEYMGWTSETTGAFGNIKVMDDKARYLVIYSSAKQQAAQTYWEQSPTTFSAEAPVKMNSAGSFKIPHGPDGVVYVGIENDTYRKAVQNAVCGKSPGGKGVISTIRSVVDNDLLRRKMDNPKDKGT
ncbi:maltose operon substrate-binding protein precursor MalM [Luteibacter rhizovicinus]|uniref:Maltose operon substrate-binding protein MalM n=1 Tax=Luteibacter rhizovicinus TaxID=242606 RepID=A0A4R3YWZ8_9GAMM|nr:MalM family protein [Luteibacter rhizovicinus]TCV97130.1 maltose operon substrate-binding protein precursor MalM [Luteibacter rhizovicinus]